MSWTTDKIIFELHHAVSRLPNPPYKAAAYCAGDDCSILRVYFDAALPVSEDQIEEISIALTEFYASTSSNDDVSRITFELAAFNRSQFDADVAKGFNVVLNWA